MGLQHGPPLTFIQLAPMEGVLDWVLRELLGEVGGVDRMVTEFVRVTDRLLPDHVFHRYCPELQQNGRTHTGIPVFIQLLGGKPEPMAENAARAAALGAPGIDLNFGCPAKTVNRHDGGAALLTEPQRLYHVTKAVREAVPAGIPVTAKVRLGFQDKSLHREIGQAVEEAGADHIVVHARTKAEMYTPPAHWEYIRSMREGRRLRFVANGEIWNVADYWRCREVTGVADVALGRGLVADPALALNIRASIQEREHGVRALPVAFDRAGFARKFFAQNIAWRGPVFAVARAKQLLRYWSREDAVALQWFDSVKHMHAADDVARFLKEELSPSKSIPAAAAFTASAPRTC